MNYRIGEKITVSVNREMGDSARRSAAHYVASRLEISGRRAEKLCALGAVKFNGTVISADTTTALRRGDIFEIVIPENWLPHLVPTQMPLDILYEDQFLVAVNKPSGIIVHSARGHLFGNALQNGVLYRYRDDQNADKVIAPPHRLDRDTSGVNLFSRTGEAYRKLCALFKNRGVEKTYWAIVEGEPKWEKIRVDAPLGINPHNPKIGAVVAIENGGKSATTDFETVRRCDGIALVIAYPHTGRAHQIRLHLQHLGLPIVGDRDYNPQGKIAFPRQALHAGALKFSHPFTEEICEITAPFPADMATLSPE